MPGSEAGSLNSARSARSNRSGRYRAVARGNTVDESLFGGGGANGKTKRASQAERTGRSIMGSNRTVVSRSELAAMKARSIVRTLQEEQQEAAQRESELEHKREASRRRKQYMLRKEEESKAKKVLSDVEIEQKAEAEALRVKAMAQVDENHDAVKLLATLGARATAFTIRDKQLQAKVSREREELEYDRRMDMVMEIDRLRDLQRREQEEKRKAAKRKEDRNVLSDQIEERRRIALAQEEAIEQEKVQMLQQIKRVQEEDEQRQVQRLEEIRKGREEVLRANQKAIQARKLVKMREREEDEKILAYQKMKAAEAAEREREEEERKQAAEMRTAKLRAMQEKTQNKQAELDELRARRAAEAKERAARQQEYQEEMKRREDLRLMQLAREQQAMHKQAALAREAERMKIEYNEIVRQASVVAEQERQSLHRQQENAVAHKELLIKQIDEKQSERINSRRHLADEGRHMREEFLKEKAKLEAIRRRKVEELRKAGVNERYLSEMIQIDIAKLQLR